MSSRRPSVGRLAIPVATVLETASFSRPFFFAALIVIGFANGISEKVYGSVADHGFLAAGLRTFDISILLWGGCLAALAMLVRAPAADPFRRGDYGIALLSGLAFLVPIPSASWLGLCLVSFHLLATASGSEMRRAAAILFALTLPLFWTRLLFAAFNDAILRLDANVIGLVVGTTPEGNVVPFADGSGAMFIGPGCSSLSNLSLALLSAAIFVNLRGGGWSRATLAWSAASAVAVIAINVTRISLIGFYPSQFDLIHGPTGAAVADCLALAAIVLIGYHRIGHDDAPRVPPQDAGRLSS